MDQEPGTCTFLQPGILKISGHAPKTYKNCSSCFVNIGFMLNNVGFHFLFGIVEFQGDEALPGRLLKVLKDALVAGIIRNCQHEMGGSMEKSPKFFDRQFTSVVSQGMDHHSRVFSGLDNFIKVADGSMPNRHG